MRGGQSEDKKKEKIKYLSLTLPQHQEPLVRQSQKKGAEAPRSRVGAGVTALWTFEVENHMACPSVQA